jgi:hypothetical protein
MIGKLVVFFLELFSLLFLPDFRIFKQAESCFSFAEVRVLWRNYPEVTRGFFSMSDVVLHGGRGVNVSREARVIVRK